MLNIITGPRGIGKTTALLAFIDRLKKEGEKTAGILSPAHFNGGNEKNGFDAEDQGTGERWQMARMDTSLDGPSFGPFSFSAAGLEKALNILRTALAEPAGPFFLDEIGPLELRKGLGFSPILPLLGEAARKRDVFLVIRPELIDEFLDRFAGAAESRIITITEENREDPRLFSTR